MSLLLVVVWTKLSKTEREFDTYVTKTLPNIDSSTAHVDSIGHNSITVTYKTPIK